MKFLVFNIGLLLISLSQNASINKMDNVRKIIPNITRKVENKINVEEEMFYATEDLTVLNDYDTDGDINELNNKYSLYSTSNVFEGDSFVSNIDFLRTYYKHSYRNFPKNELGSCGYTALAMFLSFYDTYWNDFFIDEKYESKTKTKINSNDIYNLKASAYSSPGVFENTMNFNHNNFVSEILSTGIKKDSTQYKEELDKKYCNYIYSQIDSGTFLGYLLSISIDNGFIKPHYDRDMSTVINPKNYVDNLGVTNNITNTNLQSFINKNPFLKGKVEIVTSKMKDDSESEKKRIRSEIVEIVKSGRPVLMGGHFYTDDKKTNIGRHAAIAYDYDNLSDTLYGNLGYGINDTYVDFDKKFNIKISDYWTLKITGECKKERTDHYVFVDKAAYYSPGFNSIFHFVPSYKMGAAEESYYTNIVNTEIIYQDIDQNIKTSYLRCGYIMKKCVNISTRRIGDGIAFSEYETISPIKRIEFDASWWSDDERVTKDDSFYHLEIYFNGEYITLFDFWNDIDLSKNKDNPDHLNLYFPVGINKFRFYGYSSNPINDRNKGRLSIFDMLIEYR